MSVYERVYKNNRENEIWFVLFSRKQVYKLGIMESMFTNKHILSIVNCVSIRKNSVHALLRVLLNQIGYIWIWLFCGQVHNWLYNNDE